MTVNPAFNVSRVSGFLSRIGRDTSGNTLMIVAAALLPLLGMVGGGLDIGRGYLVHARLQQACDAGVLAARQRLGTEVVTSGEIPSDTEEVGERFFNTNFSSSTYGTTTRDFQMTLEEDYAISAVATSRMPTTLMAIFGEDYIDVSVDCSAQLNMQNTDIMMALDVTGSMGWSNPGESESRLDVLTDVIRNFHAQLSSSAEAGGRIRYGFVPYSTNVNVGHLLQDDWVVDEWRYSSRALVPIGSLTTETTYTSAVRVSGSVSDSFYDTYSPSGSPGSYSCNSVPSDALTTNTVVTNTEDEYVIGPPAGTQTTETIERTRNGTSYSVTLDGDSCTVTQTTYVDYVDTYDRITSPAMGNDTSWLYASLYRDVSNWRDETNGCIEERQTYEIDDYDNVDFSRALDLNLDLVPTDDPASAGVTVVESLAADSGNNNLIERMLDDGSVTKWRPMYPELIFGRAKRWNGNGNFTNNRRISPHDFITPATSACPPRAMNLQTLTSEQLDTFLDTLVPQGNTYHDIGMIWAGRLISPTGLFAAENADEGSPTSRNLIFLTDGETAPRDIAYGAYGFEPVDQRRWSQSSSMGLTDVVEARFAVACNEVRRRGITVWVIGFGTELNDIMRDCAGEGHYFEAADAAELNVVFAEIATSVAELRIVQ